MADVERRQPQTVLAFFTSLQWCKTGMVRRHEADSVHRRMNDLDALDARVCWPRIVPGTSKSLASWNQAIAPGPEIRCFLLAEFAGIRCDSLKGIRILANPATLERGDSEHTDSSFCRSECLECLPRHWARIASDTSQNGSPW